MFNDLTVVTVRSVAHSRSVQLSTAVTFRQHYLLTVGKCWFTINTDFIVVSANYSNRVNMIQPIMFLF